MKWQIFKKDYCFDNEKNYLFFEYNEKHKRYFHEFIGTIESANNFRKYEMENKFTHFIELEKPQ